MPEAHWATQPVIGACSSGVWSSLDDSACQWGVQLCQVEPVWLPSIAPVSTSDRLAHQSGRACLKQELRQRLRLKQGLRQRQTTACMPACLQGVHYENRMVTGWKAPLFYRHMPEEKSQEVWDGARYSKLEGVQCQHAAKRCGGGWDRFEIHLVWGGAVFLTVSFNFINTSDTTHASNLVYPHISILTHTVHK